MSLKRILNELHNKIPYKLLDYHVFNKFYFVEIGNDIICRDIGIVNKKTNTIEIKLYIPSNYPFYPPKVTINTLNNEIDYLRWLSKIINYNCINFNSINFNEKYYNAWIFSIIKWPQFKKYLKFPERNTCYCCESIICSNKWSPAILLSDILFEYIILKQFLIFSNILNQRQINNIFNNDNWTIPNEIINHILSFLE